MSDLTPTLPTKPEVFKRERKSRAIEKNDRLRDLITSLRLGYHTNGAQSLRNQYRDDLLASIEAFGKYKENMVPQGLPCTLEEVIFDYAVCEGHVIEILNYIRNLLGAKTAANRLLELSGLWPRLTARDLLSCLSSKSTIPLTSSWKSCLLVLGEALTVLQRARRLILAGEQANVSAFCNEIENEGHRGWNPEDWPDWVLIELESDFLIRPTQVRVALEMIQPKSSANSLVQLNMGEYPYLCVPVSFADDSFR